MRCDCLRCEWNDVDGYCYAPEGKVTINENGMCDYLFIPVVREEDCGEERKDGSE